jgi:hypothetical protein
MARHSAVRIAVMSGPGFLSSGMRRLAYRFSLTNNSYQRAEVAVSQGAVGSTTAMACAWTAYRHATARSRCSTARIASAPARPDRSTRRSRAATRHPPAFCSRTRYTFQTSGPAAQVGDSARPAWQERLQSGTIAAGAEVSPPSSCLLHSRIDLIRRSGVVRREHSSRGTVLRSAARVVASVQLSH